MASIVSAPGTIPRDQRGDLQTGVGPGRPRDSHVSSGQVVQPGPLGQRTSGTRPAHDTRFG